VPSEVQDRADTAVQAVSRLVNIMGDGEVQFIEGMTREHRTLQQAFTRLCVKWLEDLAVREHFDPRNEASVNLGKLFVERLDEYERHLPTI
jgi:hypothetical protein